MPEVRTSVMGAQWAIGVDFGGTAIKGGLVNVAGRVVASEVLPSKPYGQPSAFVKAVGACAERLLRQAGVRLAQCAGIGVGAPGSVNGARGVVHTLVNVPGWRDVPLARRLSARLGCRCVVDNDANLYALGEWRYGAGRGARHLLCVTLGTGVGGGLILGGRLHRGAGGAAGEVGHMVIDPRGPRCGCGRRGCLEAFIGTAGILRLARRAIRQDGGLLRRFSEAARGRLSPELISRAARQGDRGARALWREIGERLGIGLANLVNTLNPDCIVIGGGVAKAWPFFAPTLMRTVRTQAMTVPGRAVRMVPARLGSSAGILGAAVLVWSKSET